ncbi:MAG: endonuclease III domain-containing protein, partial [Planctomycetota bacterium]
FGSVDAMFESPTDELRASLLSVSGVGPETADAILLYAGDRPRFVIDAYTRRVVGRHGWRDDLSYGGLQQWFESELPADAAVFNEYHALMVEVGKRHCGPKPKCDGCPLRPMLP